MTCSSFMFEISYMYISTSSTMTSVFRFILTARIEDGKRSSQIMDCRYMSNQVSESTIRDSENPSLLHWNQNLQRTLVFTICNLRGLR